MITLLLALTDRFTKGYGVSDTQARELLGRIKSEYERALLQWHRGGTPGQGEIDTKHS